MKLVIISNKAAMEIQNEVVEMFSEIPNKDIKMENLYINKNIFIKDNNQLIRIKGKEKGKFLVMLFEVDPIMENYYKKSLEFILYHFTHNGPDSIHRFLKRNQFINEMSVEILESNKV